MDVQAKKLYGSTSIEKLRLRLDAVAIAAELEDRPRPLAQVFSDAETILDFVFAEGRDRMPM